MMKKYFIIIWIVIIIILLFSCSKYDYNYAKKFVLKYKNSDLTLFFDINLFRRGDSLYYIKFYNNNEKYIDTTNLYNISLLQKDWNKYIIQDKIEVNDIEVFANTYNISFDCAQKFMKINSIYLIEMFKNMDDLIYINSNPDNGKYIEFCFDANNSIYFIPNIKNINTNVPEGRRIIKAISESKIISENWYYFSFD